MRHSPACSSSAPARNAAAREGCCPCCGQPAQFPRVTVSLDFNSLSFRGQVVFLPRQMTEIASVLAGRMPGICTREALIARAWGVRFVDDCAVRVGVSRLRRLIKRIGLAIESIRGVGWRLIVISEQTENAVGLESSAVPEPVAVVPAAAAGSSSLRRAS